MHTHEPIMYEKKEEQKNAAFSKLQQMSKVLKDDVSSVGKDPVEFKRDTALRINGSALFAMAAK